MSIDLTQIPKIMRYNKWNKGADLMDYWFSQKPAVAPKYGRANTHTIQMDDFVLTFRRAKNVFDGIVKEKIWSNDPARKECAAMLARNKLLGHGKMSFGRLGDPISAQDENYINFRSVGFSLSDYDDLAMALGNFTFRVVVAGTVEPSPQSGRHRVSISEVGVYVRDSYDFNGIQPLGYWNDEAKSMSIYNPFAGTEVNNTSFREWRNANNMGGDFLVFSDLKRIVLTVPDVFAICSQ